MIDSVFLLLRRDQALHNSFDVFNRPAGNNRTSVLSEINRAIGQHDLIGWEPRRRIERRRLDQQAVPRLDDVLRENGRLQFAGGRRVKRRVLPKFLRRVEHPLVGRKERETPDRRSRATAGEHR